MYLFDILGVSTQETCYAYLIATAFKESKEFQHGFIKALVPECESAEGWKCLPEFQVKVPGKSLRPDLLFVNSSIETVILVEMKV
jgi:hypothetical protein